MYLMMDGFPSGEKSQEERVEIDIARSLTEASVILEMLENGTPLDLNARHVLSRLLHVHGVNPAASGEPLLPNMNEAVRLLEQRVFDAEELQKSIVRGGKVEDLSDEERSFLAKFTGNTNLVPEDEPEPPATGPFTDTLNRTVDGDR